MDYKELLIKYMHLVIFSEGIDYINRIGEGEPVLFSEEEKLELEKISELYGKDTEK